MITQEELAELLSSDETARIEKTESTTNTDKFCEAICSFANDMSNSRQNGYLLIGVRDNGTLSGLKITDEFQLKISAIRSDGNILPIPTMNVTPFRFEDGDVLVVEVLPSFAPPVRYKGRTCIRVGARKGYATIEEEQILSERVPVNNPPFDTTPCREATINDIDVALFEKEYLDKAIVEQDGVEDNRTAKEKMAALRLYNMQYDCPTYASIVLFGKNPKYFLPGDYIQFVYFDGVDNAANISNEHEFKECLVRMLPKLDTFIETSIAKKRPVPISALREKTVYKYPLWAIRELMMNAVMHRNYSSNTPTKFYQYSDRLEIVNAGGLYGNANAENFPNVNDYRNPVIAEAMKVLGYVNKYNRGIARVNSELVDNGNGEAKFEVGKITVFEVYVNDAEAMDRKRYGTPSSNQVTEQVTKQSEQVTEQVTKQSEQVLLIEGHLSNTRLDLDKILSILSLLSTVESKSAKELFAELDFPNISSNRSYINRITDLNLVSRTQQSAKAPNQRYFITDLGRAYLEYKCYAKD